MELVCLYLQTFRRQYARNFNLRLVVLVKSRRRLISRFRDGVAYLISETPTRHKFHLKPCPWQQKDKVQDDLLSLNQKKRDR